MTIRRGVGVALVISLAVLGLAPTKANAYQTHPANSWTGGTGNNTSASSTLPSGERVTMADTGAITISGLNVTAGSRGMKAGMYTPAIAQNTPFLEFTTQPTACASGVTCDNLGTITVSFGQPVRDPVLHLAGIGASSGSAQSQAQFRLTASTPAGASLGPASSGATNLQVTGGNTIAVVTKRSNTSCTTTTSGGSTAGCGSVPVVGTVTSLTFHVDQTSDGTGAVTADAFVLGTSVHEDFGDAPASYDAPVAASHVVGDLRLGAREDPDNTAVSNNGGVTPSPNAVAPGADITTPDNDGVAVPLPPLNVADAGRPYTVPVTVSGGSKASRLCGWIDFNGNGVFDNPAERACANVPAGATSVGLVWTVPANVQPGFTYARFRIGYTAGQVEVPTGLADSGEVEDYRLAIDSMLIKKTADRTTANPGDKVTYTVTVTNEGPRPTTGVTVTDDLSAVLDDATYNQDAKATTGSFAYSAPKLTWTGDAGPGRTITLTYSVTVANPDTGDHQLRNGITTNTGNCRSGSTDPNCTTTVNVASMSITKKVDRQTANPGDKVTYTVTVTNTGRTTLTAATFTDNLTGVLDDATYNNDAPPSATYTAPNLTWTGTLAIGATATVTYSVTIKNPDTGDFTLTNTITSTTPGNNCPTNCTTTTPVAGMKITKKASPTQGKPGDKVTYTVTVTNIGRTTLTAATFTDNLTGVLDDATYNNDAPPSVTYTAPNLTWTGTLAIGATATVTYSVTIKNPDTGDHQLINTITSTTPATNCPSPDCGTTTPVAGIEITKKASATQANPGDRITYTVTVTNTGRTPQNGATFTDDLTGVLDDATYNKDGSATLGGITYTAPKLTWTGDLPVGATATVTYSVTVANPDTGDHTLTNAITSTTPGNNCPCTTTTPVAGMTIVKRATPTQADPGGTVTYTVTATNTGKTTLTNATFTDNLTNVLDDATYNNDGSATTGTVTYTAPNLTWTGTLAIGSSATITYSVLVNKTGDHRLNNTITSTTPGNNCPSPDCTTSTPVSGVHITKKASASTANPGDRITYTVTVTNTGQTTLTNATFTDNLTNVLDDATYNNDAPPSATYTAPNLTWTGTLAVGASATITYSVQVNNPDTGDHQLTNTVTSTTPSNNCDPACTTTTPVSGLTITKKASTTKANPGDKVTYTVTVTNTGQTVQTGATFTDDLTKALDDATYHNDATATIGATSYTKPKLTWTGDLPIGATTTVTYSVQVNNPDTGDHKLTNAVTSTTPGDNCPPGNTDPRCGTNTSITPQPPTPTPPTPTPPQPLAFTGVVVYPVLGAALLLILLGIAVLRHARRRSAR